MIQICCYICMMLLEMRGLTDNPEFPKAGKHRELELAQIKKSEEAV